MNAVLRFFLVMLFLFEPIACLYADAKIYQTQITVPTYGVGAPDPNPRFYAGRVYQGAQGRIYPYPISDVLTNELAAKNYTAVFLENDYLKICVLPEIGGRIFEAVDKTNGYNFFYKQSVIKPSLIGMLGAWISGGVEWNFPHHHRANTFMSMDYTIQENEDGSKTLWLTEIERRHRIKMLIGLTIWPDKNVLQAELKFFNRTPFVHSFLYFANPAVHVDSTYQVIFPPEVEFVTQHAKREFSQWPISNAYYGGFDYKNVDISWWKNLPEPVSFFAWDHSSDYFGGYDHGKKAGVVYVADVHLAPGKKFFTFGCADEGQMWDKMLTDTDGPYLELMAGGYSDNQPDYSWIQPYETKTIKQTWFPIRDLGGLSYANHNGALNFTVAEKTAKLKMITTTAQKNVTVTLTSAGVIFSQQKIDVSPDKPWQAEITLPQATRETDILISVLGENGQELLSYQPRAKAGAPMPERVHPPTRPESYQTNEELYLAGLRLDEFHNPQISPYPYYNEALKRDSSDVRVNTQLGILYCKRAMWEQAEKHLLHAVDRLTANYTRPQDGDAHYYLGVAQRALGKNEQAYDAFYRAAWNFAWRAAAFYELAELDCLTGNYTKALAHVEEALAVNTQNVKALNLNSAILRRLGFVEDAKKINDLAAAFDPLDYWTLNELGEIHKAQNKTAAQQTEASLTKKMQGDDQLYLELATDYGNAGFYQEAVDVLKRQAASTYPLISYYLAYYSHQLGNEAAVAYFLVQAGTLPTDYCFPFRLETIPVLNFATEMQPQDANAFYYLGNLLFDLQPERAMLLWQKAVELDPQLAIAHRNLGLGYAQIENDVTKAIACYEKAIEINKNDARLFYELDVLYESENKELKNRLALLKKNNKAVEQRDDALARLCELQVLTGDYDEAIKTLTSHHFNVWEGGGEIHDVFVNAHLLRGLKFMQARRYEKALADFTTATEYPDNLEVGRPLQDLKACRSNFFLGQAYERLGKKELAQQCYTTAAALDVRDDFSFYQANALLKSSQKEKGEAMFDRLIDQGTGRLQSNEDVDFFAKFGEKGLQNSRLARAHYLIGLGCYGKGDTERAQTEFRQAHNLDINNVWVNYYLELLTAKKK